MATLRGPQAQEPARRSYECIDLKGSGDTGDRWRSKKRCRWHGVPSGIFRDQWRTLQLRRALNYSNRKD